MRPLAAAAALCAAALVAPLALTADLVPADAQHAAAPTRHSPARHSPARAGGLVVTTRVAGLSHPWDVRQIDHHRLLVTQRDPVALTVVDGRTQHDVAFPAARVFDQGETGLLGLEVDPAFSRNHRFYTCSGWNTGGDGHDVRVNAWRMNADDTRARLIGPLVTGFPSTSGRHGGCRLLIAPDGSMYVGTGDAATGTNPESLNSLGGKTLRLDYRTGRPWHTNPFIHAKNLQRRYIQTYGHRNVQGLARRANGTIWSIEQGTDRNDEVNLLKNGGDYGYNPVPGYNESVPMTDQGLPGRQVNARWRSGNPTFATSGGTFVYGRRWGALAGTLAVAALKDEKMVFLKFGPHGFLRRTFTPPALRRFGRLRTAVQLPNGNLLVCTDGDSGTDRVLLVRPRTAG